MNPSSSPESAANYSAQLEAAPPSLSSSSAAGDRPEITDIRQLVAHAVRALESPV